MKKIWEKESLRHELKTPWAMSTVGPRSEHDDEELGDDDEVSWCSTSSTQFIHLFQQFFHPLFPGSSSWSSWWRFPLEYLLRNSISWHAQYVRSPFQTQLSNPVSCGAVPSLLLNLISCLVVFLNSYFQLCCQCPWFCIVSHHRHHRCI